MAGMIPAPMGATPSTPAAAAPGKIPTPQAVTAKMHLPPRMKKPFAAVVAAGLKIMFDAKTHQLMLKELEKQAPMASRLGEGIAGLMALLFQHSNRGIAPQLLIPAGMVLMAHAADFMNKTGQTVTSVDYGQAQVVMQEAMMQAFHLNPQKVYASIARMGQKGPQ